MSGISPLGSNPIGTCYYSGQQTNFAQMVLDKRQDIESIAESIIKEIRNSSDTPSFVGGI